MIKSKTYADDVCVLSNRSDVAELLSSMDVFILPSLREGLPVSVVEAQAVGVRCLIANHITDDVLLTDTIKKLNIDNVQEWVDEIICPTEYGRHNGLDEFDIEKVTKRLLSIYLDSMNNNKNHKQSS